jgi:tRNA (cmo5U34)-methyltransferase
MNAKDAFDADAAIYDRSRRQLVPGFDVFYRTAIEAIPFQPDAAIRVLDLGAGTGLLSSLVLAAFPNAHVTLADISEEMLAQARRRFSGSAAAVECVVMDFGSATLPESFDLVISALAIHHLSHDGKQRLFRAVFAALRAGGAFINADQALGPTPAAEARYQAMWLRSARTSGVSDADLAAALERMRADRSATLADQLQWLTDAGFRGVDCWYKHYRFAVFGGFK